VSTVRVKICGLTRPADIAAAVDAGADAIGFVFVPRSSRYLQSDTASGLCRSVPAFVSRVGLFLDQEADFVNRILKEVPLSLLQFHGTEDAAYCRQFGLPYIKAVNMDGEDPLASAETAYEDAAGILLDSHQHGGLGGTGKTLDWRQLSAGGLPLILAGGLNADNVAAAVRTVRPWAVDVSSGVESSPGVKDPFAIRQFIKEAKREQQS
jgi:phosphoribosylanthranilate isomerase